MRCRGRRPFCNQLDLMAVNFPMPWRKQNVVRHTGYPPNRLFVCECTLSVSRHVLLDLAVSALSSPMMTRSISCRLSSRHSWPQRLSRCAISPSVAISFLVALALLTRSLSPVKEAAAAISRQVRTLAFCILSVYFLVKFICEPGEKVDMAAH